MVVHAEIVETPTIPYLLRAQILLSVEIADKAIRPVAAFALCRVIELILRACILDVMRAEFGLIVVLPLYRIPYVRGRGADVLL